jgi:hypothetical protein
METNDRTPPKNTKIIEILTAALEEARQGRITNLALITFDAGGVHQRSVVQHTQMEPAEVERIVGEINETARGLIGNVRQMEVRRSTKTASGRGGKAPSR